MKASTSSRSFNARLAGWLFAAYSLVYLAYVLVNGFAPELVEWRPAGGVNLAIWWGFGLIGLAFLEAIVYGILCKHEEASEKGSMAGLHPPISGKAASLSVASSTSEEEPTE